MFRGLLHVLTVSSLTSFVCQSSVTSLSVGVACERWGKVVWEGMAVGFVLWEPMPQTF